MSPLNYFAQLIQYIKGRLHLVKTESCIKIKHATDNPYERADHIPVDSVQHSSPGFASDNSTIAVVLDGEEIGLPTVVEHFPSRDISVDPGEYSSHYVARVVLNEEQRRLYNDITKSSAKFIALNGVAGSGKTALAKHILKKHVGIYMGPTHQVANNIHGGITCDKFIKDHLGIPAKNMPAWFSVKRGLTSGATYERIKESVMNELCKPALVKTFPNADELEYIILDEFSLIGANYFLLILWTIHLYYSHAKVLVLGDIQQNPAIGSSVNNNVDSISLMDEIYILFHQERSKDPAQILLLNTLSLGKELDHSVVSDIVVDFIDVRDFFDESGIIPSILITASNRDMYQYMLKIYSGLDRLQDVYWMRNKLVPIDENFAFLPLLFGSEYLYKDGKNYINVMLTGYNAKTHQVSVQTKDGRRLWLEECEYTSPRYGQYEKWSGFPLFPAPMMNSYSCQGKTLKNNYVYVDAKGMTRSQLYVALSRVQHLSQMKVLNLNTGAGPVVHFQSDIVQVGNVELPLTIKPSKSSSGPKRVVCKPYVSEVKKAAPVPRRRTKRIKKSVADEDVPIKMRLRSYKGKKQ